MSSYNKESRSTINIFSRAWKALKGKRGVSRSLVERHRRSECGELAGRVSAEILKGVSVLEELISGASTENLRQQPK
ncbi:hypothetical protein NL676_016128 [Syzygium grande]|nr:hypothetical protein NL676_016128 [Syzygium grande]